MRGLEIGIFLLCTVLGIVLIPVLIPSYNGGAGIDTGVGNFSGAAAFDWSTVHAPPQSTGNVVIDIADSAGYYFQLAITALGWIASLLFSILWSGPELLKMFFVNPVLSGVLLTLLGIVAVLAWMQITKGDDWSGRR